MFFSFLLGTDFYKHILDKYLLEFIDIRTMEEFDVLVDFPKKLILLHSSKVHNIDFSIDGHCRVYIEL